MSIKPELDVGDSGGGDGGTSSLELEFNRLALDHQGHRDESRPSSGSINGKTSGTGSLESHRRRGVVKFFNSLKGFGFVVDNDPGALGGQEVFCHFSAISGKGGFRSLAEGEEVEYELVQGPKGFQAANLTGPGGRNVVGDPKVRLTKPMPYLPFGSMSMMPSAYMADPYVQHPAMFAGVQPNMYMPAPMPVSTPQYPIYSARQVDPNFIGGRDLKNPMGNVHLAPSNGHAAPAVRFGQPSYAHSHESPSLQTFSTRGVSAPLAPAGVATTLVSSPPMKPMTFGFSPFSPPAPPHVALHDSTAPSTQRESPLPSSSSTSKPDQADPAPAPGSSGSRSEADKETEQQNPTSNRGSSSNDKAGWQSSILYSSGPDRA
ncbi:hypothetical protein OIO90_001404 [Microbotryomycetes sp. JL221]|nr:hypothetical protein OIO90_001404 [Microbotryomycetes sp. JL221]